MYITIRPLEEKDAYTSWKWRNDPEVFANTGRRYSGPVTLEDELNWIRTVLQRPDERRFAIMADDVYIGNVYLTEITESDAMISIFIGEKKYWNKGIAKTSYKLTFDFAFNSLKISNLRSIVRKENFTSIKLHDHLGFHRNSADEQNIYYCKTLIK